MLQGRDGFSGESYAIPGRYRTRAAAERAAQRYRRRHRSSLPDQVFVQRRVTADRAENEQ